MVEGDGEGKFEKYTARSFKLFLVSAKWFECDKMTGRIGGARNTHLKYENCIQNFGEQKLNGSVVIFVCVRVQY